MSSVSEIGPQVAASGTRDPSTTQRKAIQGNPGDWFRCTTDCRAKTDDSRIQEQGYERRGGEGWCLGQVREGR